MPELKDAPTAPEYSQTKEPGMAPVYEKISPKDRSSEDGPPKLLGYAYSGTVDTPKPASVLELEKKLGQTLNPYYAQTQSSHEGQGEDYGPPTGYAYDNGQGQNVLYDASGAYKGISKKRSVAQDLLPLIAAFALPFIPGIGGLLGGGAEALGTAGATLGASEGALTAAQLAALPGTATGIGTLGAGTTALEGLMGSAGIEGLGMGAELAAGAGGAGAAGAGAAGTTALESLMGSSGIEGLGMGSELATGAGAGAGATGGLTASELANLSMGNELAAGAGGGSSAAAKSVAEMVASGMGPGSAGATGAVSGALTPAELAAASGVVTEGATPALLEMARAGKGLPSINEAVASGLGPGSAGAKAAVDGTLTAEELAAAAGTAGATSKLGITDVLKLAKDKLLGSSGSGSGLGGALGLMALMSMMNKGGGGTPASTATIPELTATRSQLPYDVNKTGVNPNTPYRPGQGGVNYFSPTTYTPKAAGGGLMSLGQTNLGGYSDGGRLLQGPGDGVSDSIPAIIGKKQPARLANGEFVIPARIVSELGNGSTDAGAKRLYEMMDRVQRVRRKTKNVAANTKASKYLPA